MFSDPGMGAGVIISHSYILTCAHNVAFYDFSINNFIKADTNSVWLYFEAHATFVPHLVSPISPVPGKDLIEEFIVHPHYDGGNPPLLDIALVKLKSPLQYSTTIRPICLPASTNTMYERQWAKAIGWGHQNSMYNYFSFKFLDLIGSIVSTL